MATQTLTPEQQTNEDVAQQIRFGVQPEVNKTIQPTVSASELSQPVQPVTVPEPEVMSIPDRTGEVVNNVAKETDEFIGEQLESRKRLREKEEDYASLSNGEDLRDIFTGTLNQEFDYSETVGELKDVQLQLTDMNTGSDLTKARIAGAAGQTMAQGQREITQEDRENAVRSAGLAARAAVLQGNINTATQLAKDTVDLAFKDRTLKATNLLNQIDMLQGQVDEQTSQLLEKERRTYEAEQATIEELKGNISQAMVSGASQQEIADMNDPNVDDATKLQMAQEIIARKATEDIRLERANTQSIINQRNEVTPGSTYQSSSGPIDIPTFEEWAEENGGRVWHVGGTEEDMNNLRKEFDDEVGIMTQAGAVDSLSETAQGIVQNPGLLGNYTATRKGEILDEILASGIDTTEIAKGKKKTLPATQVENLNQATSVKADVEKLYTMLKALPGTGPIAGRLTKLNAWDPERQAIESQITRIVPGLARGIFGEVGVLTNEDVDRYTKTLANPEMTDAQIEIEHQNTLDKIDQSINQTINGFSWAGYDIDRFEEEMLVPEPEAEGTESDPLGLDI